MYSAHMGTSGWALSIVVTLVAVALIIALIAWLSRRPRVGPPLTMRREVRQETPREILDRRMALGEIGADEYKERRRALAKPSAPAA